MGIRPRMMLCEWALALGEQQSENGHLPWDGSQDGHLPWDDAPRMGTCPGRIAIREWAFAPGQIPGWAFAPGQCSTNGHLPWENCDLRMGIRPGTDPRMGSRPGMMLREWALAPGEQQSENEHWLQDTDPRTGDGVQCRPWDRRQQLIVGLIDDIASQDPRTGDDFIAGLRMQRKIQG